MKIKSDYVTHIESNGKKHYIPLLLGLRYSRRTFFNASDAKDYHHRWAARYWGTKSQADDVGKLKTLLAEAISLGAASEEEMLKAAKVVADHDTRE